MAMLQMFTGSTSACLFHRCVTQGNWLNKCLSFYPEWKRQGIEYIKDITKENEKRLLTLDEMKQTTLNNRGSIVLDYNAIINAIPKPWLDWISANKQTTDLEMDQVTIKKLDQYLKKPTDLVKLIVNKDNVIPCSVGFWQHKLQIHITDCNLNFAPPPPPPPPPQKKKNARKRFDC